MEAPASGISPIRKATVQICSGTILIAPQGHSVAHMAQPLQ
jgi:hypothetical protein